MNTLHPLANLVVALFVLFLPAHRAMAQEQDVTGLVPTASNKDVELALRGYFEEQHGWVVERIAVKGTDNEDVYLKVRFGFGDTGVPPIDLFIDTQASGTDRKTGGVTETRIKVFAWFTYGIIEDSPLRPKVLEAINAYTQNYWMPQRVYLDKEGDLSLETSLNIPGPTHSIHAEQVADAVTRMTTGWKALHEFLKERGLPTPQ